MNHFLQNRSLSPMSAAQERLSRAHRGGGARPPVHLRTRAGCPEALVIVLRNLHGDLGRLLEPLQN